MTVPSRGSAPQPATGAPVRRFGGLQFAITLLTLATALVHFYLALVEMPALTGSVDPLFLLNGLGYLALLGALYLPWRALDRWRTLARWALIGFAALTVLAWFVLTQFLGTDRTTLGYVDKLIELALIALLLVENRQQRRAA